MLIRSHSFLNHTGDPSPSCRHTYVIEGRRVCMGMAETELRLGLPGNNAAGGGDARKRGFDQTVVDLKLNLSSNTAAPDQVNRRKQLAAASANPPAKAQVVGWPPVRSFRKNMMEKQKAAVSKVVEESSGSAALVKVSMDGAPYLRKVDLRMYNTYQELSDALGNMFTNINNNGGSCGGFKDFMNEGKLVDVLNNSDYVPTYEDKDGDWMLVGDVPWEMFVESCKRLRIMKGKEAIYLAPRAMEKCKDRA